MSKKRLFNSLEEISILRDSFPEQSTTEEVESEPVEPEPEQATPPPPPPVTEVDNEEEGEESFAGIVTKVVTKKFKKGESINYIIIKQDDVDETFLARPHEFKPHEIPIGTRVEFLKEQKPGKAVLLFITSAPEVAEQLAQFHSTLPETNMRVLSVSDLTERMVRDEYSGAIEDYFLDNGMMPLYRMGTNIVVEVVG